MNRIRTIPQVVNAIHEIDQMSAITEHGIRTLANSGEFNCFFIGSRLLLDLDEVLDYFSNNKKES